ncbi:MAG: ABC transporter substrate-binding protein [Xanthobacteraceae bacterium]|uniref:ABC transporter substrate-binding protein n=1 Tax=Pseudolabrys sp. TaxID=1960880 RepID=UPI003D096293
MKKYVVAGASLLAAAVMSSAANAQGTIKIGVILPYSGQFAHTATEIDAGIKLYMKQHGDTVGGKKIEMIRKDVGGIAPPVAKRLAEELVVRDKVDILAGFVLTPNAIAACGVSAEAKKLMVIMNAATSIITTKSPYCTRTSFTLPMVTETLGAWAAKNGIKKAYTLASDYAPGHDAEQGFIRAFKANGGEIVGSVRMAVGNPDFSAYLQRAKDLNPQSIFVFVPAGAQPAAFGKAFAERGMSTATTRILGTGELTDDTALKQMGDAAKGIITAWNYDHNHKSKMNQDFVAAYKKDNKGENPSFLSVGGYDGMHLIYEALKKTKANGDADQLIGAVKGMKWDSPRGPMMIDPETNDAVETIYIRRVDKVGGRYTNVEVDSVPNVKDPVKEAMKKK